jgi:hypothetical protein
MVKDSNKKHSFLLINYAYILGRMKYICSLKFVNSRKEKKKKTITISFIL